MFIKENTTRGIAFWFLWEILKNWLIWAFHPIFRFLFWLTKLRKMKIGCVIFFALFSVCKKRRARQKWKINKLFVGLTKNEKYDEKLNNFEFLQLSSPADSKQSVNSEVSWKTQRATPLVKFLWRYYAQLFKEIHICLFVLFFTTYCH